MHIKVGFARNGREIVIESEQNQDEVLSRVQQFLDAPVDSANAAASLVLEGTKGAKVILVRGEVAYVEVGAPTKSSVGFVR